MVILYQATVENRANNWNVVQDDRFDTNENNWLVDSSDDEYAVTNYKIVDGKFNWDTKPIGLTLAG